MSEHQHHLDAETASQDVPDTDGDTGSDTGSTGHATVDEVIASVDGLDGRPVAEHVEVFEAAHDWLRSALADAGSSDHTA